MLTKIKKALQPVTVLLLLFPLFQGCSGDDDLKAIHVKVTYLNRGCGGIVLIINNPDDAGFGGSYGCGVAGCASAVLVQKSRVNFGNLKSGAEYYVDMKRIKHVPQIICDIYPSPPDVSVQLLKVY